MNLEKVANITYPSHIGEEKNGVLMQRKKKRGSKDFRLILSVRNTETKPTMDNDSHKERQTKGIG